MTIGQTIAKQRKDRNLGQRELAARAGISASHLSLIESGKRDPSLRVLARLACAVGTRVRLTWLKV